MPKWGSCGNSGGLAGGAPCSVETRGHRQSRLPARYDENSEKKYCRCRQSFLKHARSKEVLRIDSAQQSQPCVRVASIAVRHLVKVLLVVVLSEIETSLAGAMSVVMMSG